MKKKILLVDDREDNLLSMAGIWRLGVLGVVFTFSWGEMMKIFGGNKKLKGNI